MVGRIALVVVAAGVTAGASLAVAGVAHANPRAPVAHPVPSLTPAATQRLWRQLVRQPRTLSFSTLATCRPLRAVFYAGNDWLRLATKLAANASPCAEYYISVPPLVADKTQPRADQAWRIRALGPNFHALAEINYTAWSSWVADSGQSWFDAGVEARRRMAAAGYDVALGDSWVVNEFSSAVRVGSGNARAYARELVRGLYTGTGGAGVKGGVFIIGMNQSTLELGVYQARLQDWLEDEAFWRDMGAYVSDWSQELYGDVRNYAVAGASLDARRAALNEYLQHQLVLSRAAPEAAAAARAFLDATYNPLANAAWYWESAFGWTGVPIELMHDYVSAQTYALRQFRPETPLDRGGFAWAPRNNQGIDAADFAAQTDALLDRLAGAIADSAGTAVAACGTAEAWCAGTLDGATFNDRWRTFETWKPSKLVYTSAPQTVTAGAVSTPLTVELRTHNGITLTAGAPLEVSLATSSPAGSFSAAATGPWTSTLSVTIPSGVAGTTFHYSDTRAGEAQLAASAAGKVAAGQTVSVTPAALAKVAISPSSVALPLGGAQTFTAGASDAYGNAVDVPIAWSTTAPGTLSSAGGPSTVFTGGTSAGAGSVVAASGGFSATASVTVGDVVAPSAPPSVSAQALSYPRRVALSWSAASDDVAVTGYRIYRNGALIATTSARSYTDSNVARNTWYRYDVRAHDAAGNVGPAASASVKTTTR